MLAQSKDKEYLARQFYDVYCKAVGGKSFNGDPLPSSEEFFKDPSKAAQADAWRAVAEYSINPQSSSNLTRCQRYYPDVSYDIKGPVYFVGDIHAEFDRFNEELKRLERLNVITPGNLIILGDVGIGFADADGVPTEILFEYFCEKLHHRGWTVYAVRGNHDRPSCWSGHLHTTVPGLPRYLKDNSVVHIKGLPFFVSGGAVSMDRRYRTVDVDWWESEFMYVPPEAMKDLEGKIYGVLSHTGPLPPNMIPYPLDPALETDLEREEIQRQRILKMKPKKWFYGHFHCSSNFTVGDTQCRCLDIMEIQDFHESADDKN